MRAARLTAALLASLALALPANAAAQGDTAAVATNTKDGSDVFRLAFQIRRVMGDTVDQQNAAVAYASCEACRTTAISIQVLLIGGDPNVFTPGNYAIAVNENCLLCDTLASAYQFVVGVGTRVRFTAEGNRRIADIRRRLQDLRDSDLSAFDRQAQIDALMGELSDVLSNEVVAIAPSAPAPNGGGRPPQDETSTAPGETAPEPAGTTQEDEPPADTGSSETTPTETTPTETTPTETAPEESGTTTTPEGDGG